MVFISRGTFGTLGIVSQDGRQKVRSSHTTRREVRSASHRRRRRTTAILHNLRAVAMHPPLPVASSGCSRVESDAGARRHHVSASDSGIRNGGRNKSSDSSSGGRRKRESESGSVRGGGRGRGSHGSCEKHRCRTGLTARPLTRVVLVLAVYVACALPCEARGQKQELQNSSAPLPLLAVNAVASNWTAGPANASDWMVNTSSVDPETREGNATYTVDTDPPILTVGSFLASNMVLQRSPVQPLLS